MSPRKKSFAQETNRSTGGVFIPQYSSSFAICSWLMDPSAVCPTFVLSGSRGDADTRKKAAALTNSRSTAIRIKFFRINHGTLFSNAVRLLNFLLLLFSFTLTAYFQLH